MPGFAVIMAQGRSGSTLLLRMLNAVPGVRINGENCKAVDHLRAFVESFEGVTKHHHNDFYKLAWQLPCQVEDVRAKTSAFLKEIYNPGDKLRLAGFKEIRYGRATYEDLCSDIRFLGAMFGDLKIVFNTRRTDDAVESDFWRTNPDDSRQTLELSRENFERFHAEHPKFTYMMRYEAIRDGSSELQGMFDFLGV